MKTSTTKINTHELSSTAMKMKLMASTLSSLTVNIKEARDKAQEGELTQADHKKLTKLLNEQRNNIIERLTALDFTFERETPEITFERAFPNYTRSKRAS